MRRHYQINLFDLVISLSNALDLVSPTMANHHKRVAYIALRLAESVRTLEDAREDIVIAGALHDIGVLSAKERIETSLANSSHHSAAFGSQLLRKFGPFAKAAEIIRFHHVPWERGLGRCFNDSDVTMGSHILHLANRIDAEITPDRPILSQVKRICDSVSARSGTTFVPEHVEAFLSLARREAFWLDLMSPGQEQILARHATLPDIDLDLEGLLCFAELWAHVIDFRSRYTATHSSGVAETAYGLAQLIGFSENTCKQIKIAGYLHDIGKLAVPVELLEKQGKLSEEERLSIHAHPYHSFRILQPIAGLEDITMWSALHHERLDGSGYPFHFTDEDIPLEARIVAVADVFTALTEDRPYRSGMEENDVREILVKMAEEHALDGRVVHCVCDHYGQVNERRRQAQSEAVRLYEEFMGSLRVLDLTWAREAHLLWKKRLRDYLDGKHDLSTQDLLSHKNCALGQWYFGEGMTHYGHIPEMQDLEEPHRALHRSVRKVMQYADAGLREQAEAALLNVEVLSVEIVRLLESIEQSSSVPREAFSNVYRLDTASVRWST